jgi:hypothetical protein
MIYNSNSSSSFQVSPDENNTSFQTSPSIHKSGNLENDLRIETKDILRSKPKDSESLFEKKVSKSPYRNQTTFQKTKKFFTRFTSTPSGEEIEFAKDFKFDIGRLELAVSKFNSQVLSTKDLEKTYKSADLFETRFNFLSTQQEELQKTLKSAQDQLTKLEEKLGSPNVDDSIEDESTITAYKLADRYTRYDSLPKAVEKLRDSVRHMEQSFKVSKQLLEIDQKMVTYIKNLQQVNQNRKTNKKFYNNSTETWNSFKELGAQIQTLHQGLIQEIRQRHDLKGNSRVQKILQKNAEDFSSQDAHELIKLVYPALAAHSARLFNDAKGLENLRINNLNKQAKTFEFLTSIYYSKAAQINDLENSLYAPSIAEKFIYQFNKNSRTSVEKKLDVAESEMKAISQQVQEAGQFNSEELAWLKALARKNKSLKSLDETVNQRIKKAKRLAARDKVSQNLGQIRQNLDQLASRKSQISKTENDLTIVSSQVEKLSPNEISVFEGMVKTKDNPLTRKDQLILELNELNLCQTETIKALKLAIQDTFLAIRSIENQRIIIPKTFDQLSPIEQFTLLTKTTSVHLNQKIDGIAHALSQIEDEELKKSINNLISTEIVKTIPKKINNEELKNKTAMLEYHVREYVKWILAIDVAEKQPQLDQSTSTQIKERTDKWREDVKKAKEGFEALKQEVTSYSLGTNSQDLVDQANQWMQDFASLVGAGTDYIHDYNEKKLKTINDVRGGIDSGYTAAWSESPTFRKPAEPSSLILSHTALKGRDPENAKSYQELLNAFEQLNQALQIASSTLGSFYTKDQSGAYILIENAERTTQTDETIKTLEKAVYELKEKADKISWTSTEKNSFQSSIGQSTLGQMSQQKFIATLEKILRELNQFMENTSKKD